MASDSADAVDGIPARTLILSAARSLFSRKGYAGTTTQEIADRAGVNKRLIFYYFDSKEKLYLRTLDEFFEKVRVILDDFAVSKESSGDAWMSALKFTDNFTGFVALHQEPIRIIIREIMDEGPFLEFITVTYIKPMYETGFTYFSDMFDAQGMKPQESFHFLINMTGASLMYFLIAPLISIVSSEDPLGPQSLEQRTEQMRRFLMRSI